MNDFINGIPEEGFTIDNDARANWAIKKIKEAEFEHDRLQEIINAEREELNRKQTEIDEALESQTAFLKHHLKHYFTQVPHKETKTQETYKLLDGSLVWKKPTISIVRPQDEALVAYLDLSGQKDMIEITKRPKWGDFKKTLTLTDDGEVVTDTGEILDFIETEEKEGEFNVK